ncbi:MAG: M42 family metallopeptidase [Candidatus Methanofastidiosia archaeon]
MTSLFEYLKILAGKSGAPGHEHNVSGAILKICDFTFHITDPMGNLICIKEVDKNAPTILLDAHMDEIGGLVRHINDDGYIFLEPMCKIDPRIMIGKQVLINGKKELIGTIGVLPLHVSKENKIPKFQDLPIDTGLTKEELERFVRMGDPVTFYSPLRSLGGTKICSKALDNRAGCAVLCHLSKIIDSQYNIAFLFSSQEEVGARGVQSALALCNPIFAISIDATHGDMKGVEKNKTRVLGSGPIIGVGPNIHNTISDRLRKIAERENISHTIKAYPAATPTNLRTIQTSGVPGALLSLPVRYMHTPSEVADIKDMEALAMLLKSFILSLDAPFLEEFSCY